MSQPSIALFSEQYVSEPPPIVVVFCKLHKEVLEDSKRMHKNTEQLFDHLDLLFSEWDETQLVSYNIILENYNFLLLQYVLLLLYMFRNITVLKSV